VDYSNRARPYRVTFALSLGLECQVGFPDEVTSQVPVEGGEK